MPNTTFPANARAKSIDRRAALGAIAAGALLAVPRAAKAASADAELLALQGPIDAAERELDAAIVALEIVEESEKACIPVKPTGPAMDSESRQVVEEFARRMAEIRARGPSADQVAYDEALRQWEADRARANAESGIDAAIDSLNAAQNAAMDWEDRVAETPAKTMAGLIFKAKYAAGKDYDPGVLSSIADDLLAMAGEA